MTAKKKIMCIIGTRPEAIKMAPVINELKKVDNIICQIVSTGQHKQILNPTLRLFNIKPDINLNVMTKNQSLSSLTGKLFTKIDKVIDKFLPDVVLVQGDTTTVMVISIVCFYKNVPLGHVEAGLRTGNLQEPFPEEFNRLLTSLITKWHFAPTKNAKKNLLKNGIDPKKIHITGNTVVDLLNIVQKDTKQSTPNIVLNKKIILVTAHRRENFGKPIKNICKALLKLAKLNKEICILYPVHPNPNIKKIVFKMLGNQPRIILTPPLDYQKFISIMMKSDCVLTDFGGVQEEATTLGKPVFILRNNTERIESISHKSSRLVGINCEHIFSIVQNFLSNNSSLKNVKTNPSLYGDGKAAHRIVKILVNSIFRDKSIK